MRKTIKRQASRAENKRNVGITKPINLVLKVYISAVINGWRKLKWTVRNSDWATLIILTMQLKPTTHSVRNDMVSYQRVIQIDDNSSHLD